MSLTGILFGIGCCACVLVVTLAATESDSCSDCATNSFDDEDDSVPEGELRQLMIEHIKMQILQKLRMTAPPRVTKPVIPDVLLKKHLLEENADEPLDWEFSRDDFYGRAEEVIIFPDNISTHNCYSREEDSPNSCFLFSLNRNVTTRSVRSAELWVYATGNSTSATNKTYTVSEMLRDPRRHRDGILERVVAITDTSSTGWIKFEVGPAIRTWSHSYHLTHAIQISCMGCDPSLESPVSIEEGQKPFLIVRTNPKLTETSRSKRSVSCRGDITTCCKETFLLYFDDIGWSDWIVQPRFYEANFCRGSCMFDVNASRYHHTTAIRKYIQNRGRNNNSTDLPPLNALSLELATVLDEISGVGYQRAKKRNGWIKEKHVLSDHYSREPCPESPSLCASENAEVSGVDVDPVSLDRISGFSMFSAPLFRGRKDMDTDEVGSLGYSFGSNGSLFSTDMEYVDKVGGFDHALHSEAVEHTLPIDSFDKLAGLYQIPEETQDQLSGQVALKNVSQFVDHVAPMLSNKDVSALQSILERLNVKSEEHIIHLKHPDSFADERDDADAEIIWITSEASSKTTDELKAVETASFVSDTFSISECVPEGCLPVNRDRRAVHQNACKESSDAFDEDEIIWITASEELADINESRNKTGTARTAAQSADYDHKQSLRVALECPGSSSDQDKSEFIWITSPEEDLTHVVEEPSTSKPLQTSYEDQSKSYKTTHTKPATKLSCKLYDFAGEEVIITPIVKKIPGSDYLPCLTKEHTTAKSMKTSDEDQSGTSAKQQDASSFSSPATTGKLHDFAREDVIITPLVKDTEEDASDGSDRNLSYTPEYPPFVNACYWKRPVSKNLFEDRKKLMQSCFARDSELSICNPDKFVKKNKGKTEQLDFKNSLKEVVLHLDRSVGFHEGYLKSPVTDESVRTEKLSVPYNSFLQNQNFYSLFKTMPSDSSIDDTYVKPKSTASETFDILNLEKSSGFSVIHDNSNEIRLKSSAHAVEESQYLSEAQKDSASTSAQGSTLLESSFENGASHIFQHHFHKEDNNKEMTASPARANKSFVKQNVSDHMLGLVGKCSANQQNENFDMTEIRSRLQGNETIKDASIQSENLSSVQPSACKDFIKPEEPVATKYVQNSHLSGNTPAALDNHTKDNSDYASLHSQKIHPSVSNLRGKDLKAEELCDEFCEMPSKDVFPTSSLLYTSYESNGVANESSSTDEVKKKKSARYWMKKIFIPKKFYKKNVKGIR